MGAMQQKPCLEYKPGQSFHSNANEILNADTGPGTMREKRDMLITVSSWRTLTPRYIYDLNSVSRSKKCTCPKFNTNLQWREIVERIFNINSWLECACMCSESGSCNHWVWNKPETGEYALIHLCSHGKVWQSSC